MGTQVMKFGGVKILSGKEFLEEQSALAHKYYNNLIEIEQASRNRYREIRRMYVPGLEEAEDELINIKEELDGIYDTIKLLRKEVSKPQPPDKKANPKKVGATPEQLARIAELEARRKVVGAVAKELRETFKAMTEPGDVALKERLGPLPPRISEKLKPAEIFKMCDEPAWSQAWKNIAMLSVEKANRTKAQRDVCKLGPGTYQAVEKAIGQAVKNTPGDLQFRKWENGRSARKCGIQVIQMSVSKLLEPGGKLTVLERSERRPNSRGNRARAERWRIRINMGQKFRDIEIEATIHRPLPEDAKITWVYLVPEGPNKWSLQFSLKLNAPLIERAVGEFGVLRVDFRWSKAPDGSLIVATANGKDIHVEKTIVEGFSFADHLKSVADHLFNETRAVFIDALKLDSTPDWVKEESTHVQLWKSHEKLKSIAERWAKEQAGDAVHGMWYTWKQHRLQNKEDLFCSWEEAHLWMKTTCNISTVEAFVFWLDFWRRKDTHLFAMSNGRRQRMIRRRKNNFQELAAKLCTEYTTVVFGPLEIAKAAKRKTPDKDKDELHREARKQRVWAASGTLKECLMATFGSERCRQTTREEGA